MGLARLAELAWFAEMTLSPVLLEASEPGRDLNLASRFWMKVVVFKMVQSLECINKGFF